MDKQVTKEQIGSIVTLLVAGKVPFEDAQGFIDRYKSMPSTRKKRIDRHHFRFRVLRITVPATKALDELYESLNECWDDGGNPMNEETMPRAHPSLISMKPTLGEKVAYVMQRKAPMTTAEIVDWASQNGYRLAHANERDSFLGTRKRSLEDRFDGCWSMLDLGTYSPGKYRHVPVVEYDYRRGFSLNAALDQGECWNTDYLVLLIKLED